MKKNKIMLVIDLLFAILLILTIIFNKTIESKILEKRYTMMTNSKILRFIISKIFNVYNIKLK